MSRSATRSRRTIVTEAAGWPLWWLFLACLLAGLLVAAGGLLGWGLSMRVTGILGPNRFASTTIAILGIAFFVTTLIGGAVATILGPFLIRLRQANPLNAVVLSMLLSVGGLLAIYLPVYMSGPKVSLDLSVYHGYFVALIAAQAAVYGMVYWWSLLPALKMLAAQSENSSF